MARKILLADDSVTAQNMGRKILADAGYEVITVNNGSAALKKIAEHKPDLIVLDVYMPGYSGLEVCQRLKEAGDSSRIPVLLTVGKLEPFKPEEARRVRADGFIVKPFEASELLSALSKLEDKIVPRSEPSKPGRFARATAAIEESRYDKSMAVEEDFGWKSRIVFPKKKEKAPEPEVEDPAIYNPVNKDLRTVIDHKAGEHGPAAHAHAEPYREEQRVNLGALAPEGLPKDVTPEEIAALAAAAAQVKSTLEEHKITEEKPATPANEVAAASKKDEDPVAEPVSSAAETPTAPEPVTLAEQPKSEESKKEAEPGVTATPSEVMAAIVGLEQQSSSTGSGNGSSSSSRWSSSDRDKEKADEPVTMAIAAAAAGSNSHWTAVAVALAPEEASLSLEQEMQKAYAAFAAAEAAHGQASPAAGSERTPVSAVAAESSSAVSDQTPTPVSIPAAPAPEAASPFAEVASAATEAVSAAISELASVASSYASQEPAPVVDVAPAPSPEPASPVAYPAQVVEATSEDRAVWEFSKKSEASVEAQPAESQSKIESTETRPAEVDARSAETESKPREPVSAVEEQGAASAEEKPAAAVSALSVDASSHEALSIVDKADKAEREDKNEITEAVADVAASATRVVETSQPEASAKEAVADVAATEAASPTEVSPIAISPIAGGIDDMAKKESENTAAVAWASWRKIRETGHSKAVGEPAQDAEETPAGQDSAAMAVAVGAESSPEAVDNSLDSDPEIASIVDSVLADMRPKIVEEIARKLGKKK